MNVFLSIYPQLETRGPSIPLAVDLGFVLQHGSALNSFPISLAFVESAFLFRNILIALSRFAFYEFLSPPPSPPQRPNHHMLEKPKFDVITGLHMAIDSPSFVFLQAQKTK